MEFFDKVVVVTQLLSDSLDCYRFEVCETLAVFALLVVFKETYEFFLDSRVSLRGTTFKLEVS